MNTSKKPDRGGPRRLPLHAPGMRIGLLGGSFNPAHAAHRALSLLAMKRLGLDTVWWLVTPGNPLKDVRALPPLEHRMAIAAEVAAHPRIVVTGVERQFRTRYTADFLRSLRERSAQGRFVWLMGSDLLTQFHRWGRWMDIAAAVPIAVFNRPGHLAGWILDPQKIKPGTRMPQNNLKPADLRALLEYLESLK